MQISATVLLTKVSTPGSSRCSAALTLGIGQPSPPELPRNDRLVADLEDRDVIRAMRRTWTNLPCNNAFRCLASGPNLYAGSRQVEEFSWADGLTRGSSRRSQFRTSRQFVPIESQSLRPRRKPTSPPPGLRRITQRGAILSFRPHIIAHIPGSSEDITVASLQALYYCSGGDGFYSQRAASAVGSR